MAGAAKPRDVFAVLGLRDVIDRDLAQRLRADAGPRNLIADQHGVLNTDCVFAIASSELDDLLAFCQQLAQRAEAAGSADGH